MPISLPLPSTARASARLPSEPPRCTPSAATLCANITSSLMISGTTNSCVNSRNALACSRRTALSAALLRYCNNRAPPSKTSLTLRNSSSVSGSSGVIAYNPLIPDCPLDCSSEVGWISAAHPPSGRRMRCAYPPYKTASPGVIAYNPLIRAFRLRLIILFTARPKQPVRDVLSHAGTKARAQSLPCIFLRFFYRLLHVHILRQQGRDRS